MKRKICFFNQLQQQHPTLPIVLLTAWDSNSETAIELVKLGLQTICKTLDDQKSYGILSSQSVKQASQQAC